MLQNLDPVPTALQPTKEAVIRVGALLIVKVDGVVGAHQLTSARQFQLDPQPWLATAPHEILAAPQLGPGEPLVAGAPGRGHHKVNDTLAPAGHEGRGRAS